MRSNYARPWLEKILAGRDEITASELHTRAETDGIRYHAVRFAAYQLGFEPFRIGGAAAAGHWIWKRPKVKR